MRILVVEQDLALANFLQRGFLAESHHVELTGGPEEAKALVQNREFDAAVLDVSLPEAQSLDVLRHIRLRAPQLPVLVLTKGTRSEDRVQAFDMGADDLLVKPFSFSELSARVRALGRRGARAPETELRIEDLELSRVEHTVKRGGKPITLTPKEFALLEYLMRNAGQRVTRAEIIEHVWNLSFDTMTNIVDVYINYSQGTDITSTIQTGSLGGDLQLRDQNIPQYESSLDTLAYNVATAVNTQNAAGYDLNGNAGGNIFAPPAAVAGSAQTLSVAITDPNLVAASADGTPGNNANATALANLQNQAIVSGQNPISYYSNLVFQIGNDASTATSQLSGENLLVQQIQDQIGSVSGVSLDEEGANLILYQNAYTAAAKVANVVANLFTTVIDMVPTTT